MWLSEEFLSFSCIDNTLCCAGRGRSDDSHAGKRFIVLHVELTLNTDSRGFVTSSHGARRDSFDQKLNVLHLNCVKTRPTSKLKWLTPNFAVIAHHREARSLIFFFVVEEDNNTLYLFICHECELERAVLYHQSSTLNEDHGDSTKRVPNKSRS